MSLASSYSKYTDLCKSDINVLFIYSLQHTHIHIPPLSLPLSLSTETIAAKLYVKQFASWKEKKHCVN